MCTAMSRRSVSLSQTVPMAHLTLAEALRSPVLAAGRPVVRSAAGELHRAIRWLHTTELADIAPLLRAGDLVLTTGTGLPRDDDPPALTDFAHALADAGCSGLVVELGRRWHDDVPEALARACEEVGLPLVLLREEVRFAALTQALGEQIVDRQLGELREAHRVHDTFTELSFTGAGPGEVLEAVRRLAGAPVVLENEQHRPVDFLAGADGAADQPGVEPGVEAHDEGFLDRWQHRSVLVAIPGRTGWDARNGWLVTRLGTREQGWGRLVIGSPEPPTERLVAVAERAAAALALHRLHARDRDNLLRRTHHELMVALRAEPEAPGTRQRAETVGFRLTERRFVGVVLRPAVPRSAALDVVQVVAAAVGAADAARVPALVCEVDGEVLVLLSGTRAADLDAVVDRLAERVRTRHAVLVASGRVVEEPGLLDRTLREAGQVADAVVAAGRPADRAVHRLEDTHLRGLLALLGEDERLRLFVERELAPLRAHDVERAGRAGGGLVAVLEALLTHPTSKSDAAASLHLSRAAFYDRLARIERLLGADLDDPDVRVSLHVALLADQVSAGRHGDTAAPPA